MGKAVKPIKFITNGRRLDGRKLDEYRPVKIRAGVIPQADGSAELSYGKTVAIAAVYGPKKVLPKHRENIEKAVLEFKYSMISFSTTDRCRPGPSRRSKEISKVARDALVPVILLDKYPQTKIDVVVEIINANAGTRTAAITAAAVALADAGIKMKDLVVSIASGKIDGKIALDLFQEEDNFGESDVPIAIMPSTEEITLLQMDGIMSKKEIIEGIKMCIKAGKEIHKIQRKSLIDRYKEVTIQ